MTKYTGPGGDTVIPAGVTRIVDHAFFRCTNLRSVSIPAGVTEIGGWAFWDCTGLKSVTILRRIEKIKMSSRPVYTAPRTPIDAFWTYQKPGAILGFSKLYLKGETIDEEIRAGYFKYIKGNKKKLYPFAIENEEVLQMMMQEKLIARKDVDLLMDESDKQRSYAAKAAIMQYNHENFQ